MLTPEGDEVATRGALLRRSTRVLGVIAFVAGLGAIAGLATGVLAMALLIVRDGVLGLSETLQYATIAGLFGAAIGSILGPALALTLLRSVPLGRAALVPALASSAGVAIVIALGIDTMAFFGVPVTFACAAAGMLRLRSRLPRGSVVQQR